MNNKAKHGALQAFSCLSSSSFHFYGKSVRCTIREATSKQTSLAKVTVLTTIMQNDSLQS